MDENTAIQPDVVKSVREQSLDNIISRSRQKPEEIEEVAELEEEVEELEEEVEDLVTLKVDGQELKVSRDKVLDAGTRALQKESSADRRLAEASAKEAALAKREAELEELGRQLLEKNNDKAPEEFGREFADDLFNSEEDAVAQKMSSLVKKIADLEGKTENFSKESAEAKKERARAQEKALSVATKHFHANYVDIASDAEKTLLFNQRVNQFVQDNPEKPIESVIDMAAAAYYEKFGGKPAAKASAKENLTKQPRAASARNTGPPAEKTKTRSDVLNGMRKSRGVVG